MNDLRIGHQLLKWRLMQRLPPEGAFKKVGVLAKLVHVSRPIKFG